MHNSSPRALGPFVAVNCAAFPESLLESELFGYAPASFTGADKKGKRGLFEWAHGGTIFLDEISEMNPVAQGRLLRVIQEKQIRRIGDHKVIPIDVRIIAATNKNLQSLIFKKHFREDLYYRINVLTLQLPPLRHRREDIPYLIKDFIYFYSKEFGKPCINLKEDILQYLSTYHWPGNVRELKNFIERLMVISKKIDIELCEVKNKFFAIDTSLSFPTSNPSIEEDNQELEMGNTRGMTEKQQIIKALEANRGSINFTAKDLGISRTTLWRRMKKYNLH
nr:sigma 54-interacting transcriptional regulator [Alkaliphilus pronyensis]